jgi:hypothetical protein
LEDPGAAELEGSIDPVGGMAMTEVRVTVTPPLTLNDVCTADVGLGGGVVDVMIGGVVVWDIVLEVVSPVSVGGFEVGVDGVDEVEEGVVWEVGVDVDVGVVVDVSDVALVLVGGLFLQIN